MDGILTDEEFAVSYLKLGRTLTKKYLSFLSPNLREDIIMDSYLYCLEKNYDTKLKAEPKLISCRIFNDIFTARKKAAIRNKNHLEYSEYMQAKDYKESVSYREDIETLLAKNFSSYEASILSLVLLNKITQVAVAEAFSKSESYVSLLVQRAMVILKEQLILE